MFVSPTVVGDLVIIGSCAGSVHALNRRTGEAVWQHNTADDGPKAQFHGEPLLLGDRILVPSDASPKSHVYSFDIASGKPRWKVSFEHGIATTPLLVGDHAIVVSPIAEIAKVETKSGAVVWRVEPFGAREPGLYLPSPGGSSDRVVIADNTNQILALKGSDGSTVWRTPLSGRPNTSVLVIGNEVIVGTADGYLNKLSSKTGELITRTKLPGVPYGTIMQTAGLLLVLVGNNPGNLLALDVATHEIRWQQTTPKEWTTYRPLVIGATVLVGHEGKEMCAFDAVNGQQRWCTAIGEIPRGLGMSNDGILYVGSLRGVVQAFAFKELGMR